MDRFVRDRLPARSAGVRAPIRRRLGFGEAAGGLPQEFAFPTSFL
ncbi:hypothetical protein ACIRU3_36605 [Streptomyces sp. NPDC101151]